MKKRELVKGYMKTIENVQIEVEKQEVTVKTKQNVRHIKWSKVSNTYTLVIIERRQRMEQEQYLER